MSRVAPFDFPKIQLHPRTRYFPQQIRKGEEFMAGEDSYRAKATSRLGAQK